MVDEFLPPPPSKDAPTPRTAEIAEWINDLDISRPAGGDRIGKGDDHIRLIKATTKNTFINFIDSNRLTYKQPVLYSTDVLNFIRPHINGVGGKAYYMPQKTIYDGAPTGAYHTSYSFYIEDAAQDGVRKILSGPILPPLGHIFMSILDERKLNEHYGIVYSSGVPTTPLIFKLCDGSTISGSSYATASGKTTLPNLVTDGLFLANLTDEGAVNTVVPDRSYPKGIRVNFSFDPSKLNPFAQASPEHNHSASGTGWYGGGTSGNNGVAITGQHSLRMMSGAQSVTAPAASIAHVNQRNPTAHTDDGIHSHGFTYGFTESHTFSTTVETAPKSVTLNNFIRIN